MNEDPNVGPFQSPELNGAWEIWLAHIPSNFLVRETRDDLIRRFLAGVISQQLADHDVHLAAEGYFKIHRLDFGDPPQVAVSLETLLSEWRRHATDPLQLQERRSGGSPAHLIRAGLAVKIAENLGREFTSKIPRIAMLLTEWPVSKLLAASIPHLSQVVLAHLVLAELEEAIDREYVVKLIVARLKSGSLGS